MPLELGFSGSFTWSSAPHPHVTFPLGRVRNLLPAAGRAGEDVMNVSSTAPCRAAPVPSLLHCITTLLHKALLQRFWKDSASGICPLSSGGF